MTTYRHRNSSKFFAGGLFENGPEVHAVRLSRWNGLSSIGLSDDAETSLWPLVFLLFRLRGQRRCNLTFTT